MSLSTKISSNSLLRRAANLLSPLLRLLARKSSSDYFDPLEFLVFCCVGVSNTLVDALVFSTVSYLAPPYIARVLSWIVACSWSYGLNKRWVFHAEVSGKTPILRFVIVNLVGLALSILTMQWLIVSCGWDRMPAYLVTIPIISLVNYFGYKLWSFRG